MKRFFFLLCTSALGLAAYLILKTPGSNLTAASPDELDELGKHVGGWGAKQRLSGAGDVVAGNLKQAAGALVGDFHLANQGTLDEAEGAVKYAAGKVAGGVENTIDDLHR